MAKSLSEWIETEVEEFRSRPLTWLAQYHFFRDPIRPISSDTSRFFSPADGVIVYQATVDPAECIVDIKGKPYSLQSAMRNFAYDRRSLVIGIFMTFFDVHVNRIPFAGRLSYRYLEPIDTYNHPMLQVESDILGNSRTRLEEAHYLHYNQRMLNRIDSIHLHQPYYVLQVADYDVNCITPFVLRQHAPVYQCERFSQIRYGSQVDLIIPLSDHFDFVPLQQAGHHVEGGVDALVAVNHRH